MKLETRSKKYASAQLLGACVGQAKWATHVWKDNEALQAGCVALNLNCNPGGGFWPPYSDDFCYPEDGIATCFTCSLALKTTHQICFTPSSPRCSKVRQVDNLKFSHFHFYVSLIWSWIFKDWGIPVTRGVFSMLFPIGNFHVQWRKGPGSDTPSEEQAKLFCGENTAQPRGCWECSPSISGSSHKEAVKQPSLQDPGSKLPVLHSPWGSSVKFRVRNPLSSWRDWCSPKCMWCC